MSLSAERGASVAVHPRGRGRVALALAAGAAGLVLIAAPVRDALRDSGPAASGAGESGAQATPSAPVLHTDGQRGYLVRVPATWRIEERPRVTRIVSPERSVVVAIASPTSGRLPVRVGRDAERALVGSDPPARVLRRSPGRIGRLPVRTTELVRPAAGGSPPARILSVAVASRWRTYSIQVVTAMPPNAAQFLEAGRLLDSFRLIRPA